MYTYSDELYSDFFKDVNGIRPRGILMDNWMAKTPDEKQAEWDRMQVELEEQLEEEAIAERKAIEDFKKQIADTIELGANDEETALRWLSQTETFYNGQCVESWIWSLGFIHSNYGRELATRLMDIVHFEELEEAA